MTSPLLALPPELRNRIYEYALTESTTVRILSLRRHQESAFHERHEPMVATMQPALTRTCTQIRHESLQLYYSVNIFELRILLDLRIIRQMEYMLAWLLSIGGKNRKVLGRVLVCFAEDPKTSHSPVSLVYYFGEAVKAAQSREGQRWEESQIRVRWGGAIKEDESTASEINDLCQPFRKRLQHCSIYLDA